MSCRGRGVSGGPARPPPACVFGPKGVLVIDEMGYLPMDDLGATIRFQLVSARYERAESS